MLYRVDIYVCGNIDGLQSEISVKIHGAMMKQIPTEYAEKLHISEYHPYSIYVFPYGSGYVIRVSALNEEAKEIVDAMAKLKKITLFGIREPLIVTDVKPYEPIDPQSFSSSVGNKGRLEFITPAMIKTGGRPSCKPDIPTYFYSVILKYNQFENADIDFNEFVEAYNAVQVEAYSLESTRYNVRGHIFPGMLGYVDFLFSKNKAQSQLLKTVFSYAEYCGVGGKTGMGMGGINFLCE